MPLLDPAARAQQHHAVQYCICPDVGGPDRVYCGHIGGPDDAVRYRICPNRRNHASGHGRTNARTDAPLHHAPGPGTFQYPRHVITRACCGSVRGSWGSINESRRKSNLNFCTVRMGAQQIEAEEPRM